MTQPENIRRELNPGWQVVFYLLVSDREKFTVLKRVHFLVEVCFIDVD
jgi:hypothetical protein